MSNEWKMVPVEPTPEMYAAASVDSREQGMLGAGYKAMLTAAPDVNSFAASQWREGAPPHPWDKEWFLAGLTDGSYAVLRSLPEDFTYDFTTADETYLMRHKVKRWAQLSDSSYISPEDEPVPPAGDVEVLAWLVQYQSIIPGFAGQRLVQLENPDPCSGAITELVDRAHVTRLTAEREGLLADVALRKAKHLRSCQLAIGKSQLAKQMQSELTKARELLGKAERAGLRTKALGDEVRAFLAHQSAPAAKGGA